METINYSYFRYLMSCVFESINFIIDKGFLLERELD